KILWLILFCLIFLGFNAYVISQTPQWTEKYITSYILGNLIFLITAGYMVLIYRLIRKINHSEKYDDAKIKKYYGWSLAILCVALLLVPFFFMVHVPDSAHDWDYFVVFRNAVTLQGNSFSHLPMTYNELDYFLRYPNNQFFGIIVNALLSPFRNDQARVLVLTTLSAVLTTLSVLSGSLIVKKIASLKTALLFNLIAFGFVPFYIYGAEFYTDTASIPFVMLGLLFMIYAVKSETRTKSILWWVLASITVFTGFAIKPTVVFPMIALFVFLIINKKWRKVVLFLPISAILFFGVQTGVKAIIAQDPAFTAQANKRYNLPMMHWITMSMSPINQYGGFNPQILEYSLSFSDKASKAEADKALLIKNLKEMGPLGIGKQLWRKISYTWVNGDMSDFFYTYRHSNPFVFRYFDWTAFNSNEGNITGWLLVKGAQILYWMAIAPLMFWQLGKHVFRPKNWKSDWFIPALSMFGLTVFLLIWEANSRYLYNFSPIILMLASKGLMDITSKKTKENNHAVSE
ncbi:MAG: glycosyltransferase family 39 protein, partial [Streptococcaceae bacterium]|nr:glycosyltransferase family 39 protein [Streptococcaceae bacterium]